MSGFDGVTDNLPNYHDPFNFRDSGKAKIFFNILTFVAVVVNVAKILIGGLHMDDCDVEYKIPIYLVAPLNIFGLTAVMYCFYLNTKWKRSGFICMVIAISYLLSLSWQIFGTVVVFRHANVVLIAGCETPIGDNNNNQTTTEPCCDLNTFRMAFGITIVDWIVAVLLPLSKLVYRYYAECWLWFYMSELYD